MIRNDYRRALIMLRGLDNGMTGHVRLERRTLMGSMQFTVNGAKADETYYASLFTNRGGRWNGAVLGRLGRDPRGQAGVNISFDPRNIDGMELEGYQLIAVIAAKARMICMYGFVKGSVEVDWAQVHDSAGGLAALLDAGAELPMADEASVMTLPEQADVDCCCDQEAVTEIAEAAQVVEEAQAAEEIRAAQVECCCDDEDLADDERAVEEIVQAEEPAPTITAVTYEDGQLTDELGNAVEVDESVMPAGLKLDVDITVAWPESIEALREIFLREVAFEPFKLDGYTFVKAPLATGGTDGYCAVGVRCAERRPRSVCYGIPGEYAAEPPPGLEGYRWRGDQQRGWWTIFIDAETGEELLEEAGE